MPRIGFIFKDLVPLEDIGTTVAPLLSYFKAERQAGESFCDFCDRKGLEDLTACAEKHTSADAASRGHE